MGARSGGGGGAGMGRSGAGGFTGATAKAFGSRVGTSGSVYVMGANGRRNGSGGKDYELYVEGNKGSTTFSFKSPQEGNKILKQLSNNGFKNAYGNAFNV